MSRRAFTLIELLVVISIISLLASVVLAALNTARDKGRVGAGKYFAAEVDHVASDSAVGIWDFDECSGSAVDRSGNGNTGTLVGGSSYTSSGTLTGQGCALQLNGSSGYADVANESQFDFVNTTFTLSFWFKTTSVSSQFILAKTLFGGGWGISINNGALGFLIKNSTNDNGQYAAGAKASNLADGRWHNAVAVVTTDTSVSANQNVVIYVDGALDSGSFDPMGFIYAPTSGDFFIGARLSANYFNGSLDAVRVYGKGLTATEVGKLYASEAPRFNLASK